jgi:hypothetical protein
VISIFLLAYFVCIYFDDGLIEKNHLTLFITFPYFPKSFNVMCHKEISLLSTSIHSFLICDATSMASSFTCTCQCT